MSERASVLMEARLMRAQGGCRHIGMIEGAKREVVARAPSKFMCRAQPLGINADSSSMNTCAAQTCDLFAHARDRVAWRNVVTA
jgi:hypothetical protein